MRHLANQFRKNKLIRNIIIVASGTAAAQFITMIFSPIITRIYGPEAFGILGVFVAIVAVLSPIAALTYPVAIVLPQDDFTAGVLARLSFWLSGIIASITILIVIFFSFEITNVFQLQIDARYLYFVPIFMFFSSFLQVAQQWRIRTKQFAVTAKVSIMHSLILNSSKVGIGWLHPFAISLIYVTVLGSLLHSIMLFASMKTKSTYGDSETVNKQTYFNVAKQYIDFPLFRAPQVFINALSQSSPILLLSILFGPISAGFYTLGRTVLGVPTQLIGKSVGDVLYPKLADALNKGQDLSKLIIKSTLGLAALGLLPFGVIILIGPIIFGYAFGSEWTQAGEYARWLSLWLFFMFINRPCVVAIPVLGLQKGFLIYELFSTLFKIVALIIGFYFIGDDVAALALYSIAGVLSYVFLILWVIKWSLKSSLNRT
ncbi:lipopolysaccharide biosynthesis protein [Paenibacillus daejeonensis]|uniref:lipopolysaccharide biosynthesis protein n=1 Tax=Paenibacillus daejeonensis TaxID=135193 RepID=UPI00037A8472|nr:oligosaccharide flippase family protein [Paenibacillus daejeonensis]